MQHRRPTVLAVLVALVVTCAPSAAAAEQSAPSLTSRRTLLDGLRHDTFSLTLADGAVARGNVVRVARRPTLRVEPVHAGGTIKGTQPTSTMARAQLPLGGLAAINGGFWLPAAGGKPHGVAAADREIFTGPRTQWGRPGHRGTLGIRADGSARFTRLGGKLRLHRPNQDSAAINDLNYVPLRVGGDGRGELLAYTPEWGETATAPDGSTVVTLRGLTLPVLGTTQATVSSVEETSGPIPIPADGGLLIAYGRARARLAHLTEGTTATLAVDIKPLDIDPATWIETVDALPGGPLIVRDGAMTPPDDWVAEGFSHDRHNGPRHPRTAIARTSGGRLLLVTVDGRQAHSVGLTMWELAQLLIDLGAVDGLSLDGGGSTTMTVLGTVRNRFSDPVERPVANALVVRYQPNLTVRDSSATACPTARVPDPGFRDIADSTHRAAIACAAWYAITTGRTPTEYAPRDAVTRGQMATFLARLVDHVAQHPGSGRRGPALPASAPGRFTDIRAGSPHATAIRRLAHVGIVSGGPGGLPPTRYGPGQAVTRGQMASLLDRTVTYIRDRALREGDNVFADDAGTVHEAATNRLARAGIAVGRHPGVFAPNAAVRRDAMASFLLRTVEVLAAGGTTTPPR